MCWEDDENAAELESDRMTAERGVEPPGDELAVYIGTACPRMGAELLYSKPMFCTSGYEVVFAQRHFPTGLDGN